MTRVFNDKDPLLSAQAALPIYAFVFKSLAEMGQEEKFTRGRVLEFDEQRKKNRKKAEGNIAGASFELLEYDRLSQQGTNDASSIRERWRVLGDWIGGVRVTRDWSPKVTAAASRALWVN